MNRQRLIHGDAFEETPNLPSHQYDLVVYDPPSGLDDDDILLNLYNCYVAATDDAALVWYGLNVPNLVRLLADSPWRVTRVFEIRRDYVQDPHPLGSIVYARKAHPSYGAFFIEGMETNDIFVLGEKGFDEALDTGKPEDWFQWLFWNNHLKWRYVLDPFAGLSPVGRICKSHEIGYTGIELDEEVYEAARLRLGLPMSSL